MSKQFPGRPKKCSQIPGCGACLKTQRRRAEICQSCRAEGKEKKLKEVPSTSRR